MFWTNRPMIILAAALLCLAGFAACGSEPTTETEEKMSDMYAKAADLDAPAAKQEAKEMTAHGDTRIDNYYWLNQREDPEVIAYLEAENAYFDEVFGDNKALQEKLFQEMRGRIKEEDTSVPYRDNGYFYITRYEEGKEYPIYSRKKESLEAEEQVMINVNQLAEPYDFYNAGGLSVSEDNRLLAYGEDTLSRRIYTIRIKDLTTGEYLPDVIPNTTGGSTWSNDGKYLFYSVKDKTLRPYKIMRHELGTDPARDVEIFTETDPTFLTFVYKTKSDKYIVIGSSQTLSNEYRVLDADDPTGKFRIIQPRERNLEYNIAHYQDKFYIRTNLDAKNFRLMVTPEDATTKENWTEVIPNRDDVLLESMDIFQDYLVIDERKNGISQLRIRPWDGEEYYIDFPEEAYLVGTTDNFDFDTKLLRFNYQSMKTPPSTYDFDMASRERKLLKQQEVLGGFNPDDYVTERIFVPARDGARVPVSIVYHKSFVKDGTRPLLLYGYGSYGSSMEPSFSSARLSLLDRGFAYAIAHIRGGEEMGRTWYEGGKLLNKKNTFTDFIDVGEHLVDQQYTGKEQLFAMGGSAGGLLMGAVVNMRPDLFKGIVAAVPFVDVITTMLDESIPLTTFEYDEWGNPSDPEYYAYMKSYSPYDNIEAKDYPAMLITTGLHDSQVQYWEPAKWVAKLREMKTDKNPILMHTNMEAGHGGASGRFQRLNEMARNYAWLVDLAGVDTDKVKG